jgi:hypothetical protein
MQVNKIVRIYPDPIPNPSPISPGAMVAARLLPAGHRLLGEGKGVVLWRDSLGEEGSSSIPAGGRFPPLLGEG